VARRGSDARCVSKLSIVDMRSGVWLAGRAASQHQEPGWFGPIAVRGMPMRRSATKIGMP
jgi:hypothetical protein